MPTTDAVLADSGFEGGLHADHHRLIVNHRWSREHAGGEDQNDTGFHGE